MPHVPWKVARMFKFLTSKKKQEAERSKRAVRDQRAILDQQIARLKQIASDISNKKVPNDSK